MSAPSAWGGKHHFRSSKTRARTNEGLWCLAERYMPSVGQIASQLNDADPNANWTT